MNKKHYPRNNNHILTAADQQAWLDATRGIKPIAKSKIVDKIIPENEIIKVAATKILPPSHRGGFNLTLGDRVNLSRKVVKKLDAGKLVIEAVVDLHGLNETQALSTLTNFIEKSYANGLRLILVITGKGSADKPSVIKSRIESWLNFDHIKPYLLRFSQASAKHGGMGAFYLYLRK